jgi:gas vesicle protein
LPATAEYVSDCVAEVCEECLAAAQEQVSVVLAENETPYTQNHYLFEIINKKRNEKLRRSIVRSFRPDVSYAGTNVIAVVDAAFSKNAKKSMLQHVAEEMQMALDAYGKVAAKRIIDDVPMAAQRMTRTILMKIETRLMDVTDDTLKRIMRDQPKFEEEQRRAEEKVKKMDRAHKAVRKLREL